MEISETRKKATFGPIFGELVKNRRRELKITQETLADDVFGDPNRKGDISRLENGHVLNPQSNTIRRIAEKLELSSEEISHHQVLAGELDELRSRFGSASETLENLSELTEAELLAVAVQFGFDEEQTSSHDVLKDFLNKKGDEFSQYKEQIDNLDDRVITVANLKGAAKDVAERFDFEGVEFYLAQVDELETEIVVQTKEARAANFLLRGQVEPAFRIFSSAADTFASVDPQKSLNLRNSYVVPLYRHYLNLGGDALEYALRMITNGLESEEGSKETEIRARLLNSFSAIQSEIALRTGGIEMKERLLSCVDTFREVENIFAKSGQNTQVAVAQYNLAMTIRNIVEFCEHQDEDEPYNLISEAKEKLKSSISLRDKSTDFEGWAEAVMALAFTYESHALGIEGDEQKKNFEMSLDEYRRLLDEISLEDHHDLWINANNNISSTFRTYGTRTNGPAGLELIESGVSVLQNLLEIASEKKEPVPWAICHLNLARCYKEMAEHEACRSTNSHLRTALSHTDEALTVITPDEHPRRNRDLEELKDEILQKVQVNKI